MAEVKKRRHVGNTDTDLAPTHSPKKKIKVEPTRNGSTSDTSVQWEHEGTKNKWLKHTNEQNKAISAALKAGKSSVEFKHKNATVMVLFERMVQRNVVSGWEKRIRCLSSDCTDYIWQWKDSSSKWCSYSMPISNLLEAAYSHALLSVNFEMNGKQAKVDLKKNVQTIARSKTKTTVRRIQTDLADAEAKEEAEEEQAARDIKSVTFSGKAPVDIHCTIRDKVHVFCEGSTVWDAMLNQTNVMNNNNKFYLIQLLEDNIAKKYYTWMRWGRVGFDGQNNLQSFGADLESAKAVFEKKFLDKTKNSWDERDSFMKVAGKYDLLIMDYKAENKDVVDAPLVKEEKPPAPECKLDSRVQGLVELICNIQAMEETLKEMKFDINKAPLGKLTTEQIRAGYEALKTIESCISRKDFGQTLVRACDKFYTRIPHCFGMKRPPLLRTTEEVKVKLELLQALGDIQIAVTMLKEVENDHMHPADRHYKSLNCELAPLDHSHEDFKMVKMYVDNTHASTHNQYRMEVLDVFAVNHHQQDFLDLGNRMLLWHGSRLTNWAGILSQGLRIAPPEAPVTGYMFGKGIYFADMSSKSANYCFPTRSKSTGIVLLSEVSLGKSNELLAANYNAADLPTGHRSVKALGKIAPDPAHNIIRSDGLVIPCGKSMETGVVNPNGYTLNYNEYIVYDTRQVRMRYLVKLKFDFK